jgi:putative phosphoesterase
MKILIFSDLHGDLNAAHYLYLTIKKNNPDLIVCLGDVFSYDYGDDDKLIALSLNRYSDRLIMIRGNCDDDFRSKYLCSPMVEYKEFVAFNKKILFTHGHLLDKLNLDLSNYNIIAVGHTHTYFIKELNTNTLLINPGSIAYPKNNYLGTYILIDNNEIKIYDVLGKLIELKNLDII